jgi:alpha-N-arabinofuranosidase
VKTACLAQLVNVIAPIMTETGGPAWRQTIFWPFAQWSNHGRGRVLRATVDCPSYDANYYDPRGPQDLYFPVAAPYLKFAAVQRDDGDALTLFAVNRNLTEAMPLEVTATDFGALRLHDASQLSNPDLKAVNTKQDPDRVKPMSLDGVRIEDDHLHATLPPASWTMIRLDLER